jgi:hypothetical protein
MRSRQSGERRPRVTESHIITYDVETEDLSCSCGNTSSDDGFVACDENGIECEPVGAWDGRYSCQKCGACYQMSNAPPDLITANPAPFGGGK